METATSRRRPTARGLPGAIAATAIVALTLAACGGSSAKTSSAAESAGAFSWLHPAAAPSGWTVARIPSGATFAYPSGWKRIQTDPGTASVATYDGGELTGYLNLTPGIPSEKPATWAQFRPDHEADEGDKHVVTIATGKGLPFRTGRGSCIQDSYTTISTAHYVEIACLVAGPHHAVVFVAAAPPEDWARMLPVLRRAVASVTA